MAVNVQGPGCLGFLAWTPYSLLASAERGICCVESVVFPLRSGFHLWYSLLSRVTGSVSASPPVKPRSSLKKTEDPVLSVRLVVQGYVVASVTPPPHQTGKYQPNCPDTVNHFLPTGVLVQHLLPCVFIYVQLHFFQLYKKLLRATITNRAELMQLYLYRIWANMLEQ